MKCDYIFNPRFCEFIWFFFYEKFVSDFFQIIDYWERRLVAVKVKDER